MTQDDARYDEHLMSNLGSTLNQLLQKMDELEPQQEQLILDVLSSDKISNRILRECFGIEPQTMKEEPNETKTIGIRRSWKYQCSFPLSSNVDSFLYVVDHFCKMFEGDAQIKADMLMDDIVDTITCDHKYMKMDYFALGYWTGICGFIEKFSTSGAFDNSLSLVRLQASFHHHRRFLEIFFKEKIKGQTLYDVYKLRIGYEDIRKIVLKRQLRHRDAFFDVNMRKEPIEIYLFVSTISCYKWHDRNLDAFEYGFDGVWDRTAQFGTVGGATFCGSVGAANVIGFKLDSSDGYPSEAVYALLRAVGAPTVFANVRKYTLPKNSQIVSCGKASPDVKYALACIHSLMPEITFKLTLDGSSKQIQKLIDELAHEDELTLVTALYDVYYAVGDVRTTINFELAVKHSFAMAKAGENTANFVRREKLPENLVLVKKATISPSKIVFQPPIAVRINSLLSSCDPDNVMLIEIRNDDGKRLQRNSLDDASMHYLHEAVSEKLKKGIRTGGKTYQFLGSTKRLRADHSFWAYGVDKKSSASIKNIQQSLGIEGSLATALNIQELLFAEALACVELPDEWIRQDSSERQQGMTAKFKHGIGRLSMMAHCFIADCCQLDAETYSAIRVVHGGRRGILALDPSLEGNQIVYRQSQTVFASQDSRLYVIETAKLTPAVLDKVFLTTLTSRLHGLRKAIPRADFLAPIYKVLGDCVSLFSDPSCSVTGPDSQSEADLSHIIKSPNQLAEDYGYDTQGDGLFRQAARCGQLKRLRELKKLRVRIDSTYELLPVVDEAGVLNEDEVFIQLRGSGRPASVMSSDVVLARRDTMDPAKLRHFVAVDRPEVRTALGHLFNCVVFASKGAVAPLAHLTKDASFAADSNVVVIEHAGFVFSTNETPTSVNLQYEDPVSDDIDLETHFVNYFRYLSSNNFEEVFCSLADALPQHAYSECCKRVDLLRVMLEDRVCGAPPIELQKVAKFPDFVEKISNRQTYCSLEPLGHIYRKMKFVNTEGFENSCISSSEFTCQCELIVEGSSRFDKIAEKDLSIFKKNLAGLASLYGVSVAEVLTGTTFSISDDFVSIERIDDIETTIRSHVKYLAHCCRRQFKRAMKKATNDEVLQKISAYFVASRNFPEDGGYAFPWMLQDCMMSLICSVDLELPPAPDTKVRRKILKPSSLTSDLKLTLTTNICNLIGNWIRVNKRICAITRLDVQYFSEKITELQSEAFEEAFRILKSVYEDTLIEKLRQDPATLLAETLRQMLLKSSKFVDSDFSRTQFFMTAIQTLLSSTLVQIAATGSLDILTKPKKILKEKIVDRRLLLPIDETDSTYLQVTQSQIEQYEERLREYSGCLQVNVRILPKEETTDCEFEEITARGPWFAVLNLETILLSPGYRKIAVNLFNVELQRTFSNLFIEN